MANKAVRLSKRQENELRRMVSHPFNGSYRMWTPVQFQGAKTGVYRTHDILAEKGLITIEPTDEPTRKIHAITEAGRDWLKQHGY